MRKCISSPISQSIKNHLYFLPPPHSTTYTHTTRGVGFKAFPENILLLTKCINTTKSDIFCYTQKKHFQKMLNRLTGKFKKKSVMEKQTDIQFREKRVTVTGQKTNSLTDNSEKGHHGQTCHYKINPNMI